MKDAGEKIMTWQYMSGHAWSFCRKTADACTSAAKDSGFIGRYVSMGAMITVINFGVFWIATEQLGIWYVYATILAFLARSAFKFTSIRSWLFGDRIPGSIALHTAQFIALEAINLAAGVTLIAFFVELLGFPPFLGLVAMALITSVLALILTRHTFRPPGY